MTAISQQELFDRLGLNPNEADVYRHLLRQGQSSASQISRQTEVSRTNTYYVLDQLTKKGLVAPSDEGKKRTYRVEHPHRLNDLFDQQQRRLTDTKQQLESMIEDIVAEYSLAEHRPGVFRFEGREGLIRTYKELLRDGADVDAIQDRGRVREFIKEYNPEWLIARRRKKMFVRVITPASPGALAINSDDSREMREVRYFPQQSFPCDIDIKVTAHKLAITTFQEDSAVGIVIIDKAITRNFRMLYNLLWSMAEKFPLGR